MNIDLQLCNFLSTLPRLLTIFFTYTSPAENENKKQKRVPIKSIHFSVLLKLPKRNLGRRINELVQFGHIDFHDIPFV